MIKHIGNLIAISTHPSYIHPRYREVNRTRVETLERMGYPPSIARRYERLEALENTLLDRLDLGIITREERVALRAIQRKLEELDRIVEERKR